MDEKIKTKILDYKKRLKEPVSIKEMSKATGINYSTALKYCEIMQGQGLLKIKEMGSAKVILGD